MSLRSQLRRQRDFSGGEVAPEAKRRDDVPQVRAAGRSMLNWRITATGALCQRPGRMALFQQEGRTDIVVLPGDLTFKICFGESGTGTWGIRDEFDAAIASNNGYPWGVGTVSLISWTVIGSDIVACYPGMVPQVARRAPDGTWSFFDYEFRIGSSNELRAPFYRFPETRGITMTPSSNAGAINVVFSADVLDPAHVGTFFRYKGRQIEIVSVVDPQNATAAVKEYLATAERLAVTSSVGFAVGQVIQGGTSNTSAEITGVDVGGANTLDVACNNNYSTGFSNGETIVGPTARTTVTGVPTILTPQASTQWDEQAVSDVRGWPQGCLNDRNRLLFYDLPQIPEGIAWSAIGDYQDFLVGADAAAPIFETVPGRARVLYVTGGADEFVFTNRGVYYIPISESNPLKPGSVTFRRITSEGCGPIAPVAMNEGILFVNPGGTRVIAIVQAGLQTRPYVAQDVTEISSHLIKSPVCLAASSGDGTFPERYLYVLNADGTVAVGRFSTDKKWVGWTPWVTSNGYVVWVSSSGGTTLFTTLYLDGGGRYLVETVDESIPLDGFIPYNAVPLELAPPGGGLTGPAWMFAEGTVDVMSDGRYLGTRAVDAAGDLVPLANDDFSGFDIKIGKAWTQEFEPFVPHADEGIDGGQTMNVRRVKQVAVAVQHSVGFTFGNRDIPAYEWGEDAADDPVERERTYKFRMLGRTVDPRFTITRAAPGTITINEVSMQVTV